MLFFYRFLVALHPVGCISVHDDRIGGEKERRNKRNQERI